MIGLDTNVLARYLVQDEPGQGERAARLIQGVSSREEPLLINAVVLCELVWVLESAYRYRRAEIADVLEKILSTAGFEIENKDAAWLALREYRASQADYADCFIGRQNRRLGCDVTVTFDRALTGLENFKLL